MRKQLVLASSSPRRSEILTQTRIPFIVSTSTINEIEIIENNPLERVKKLAQLKGRDVKRRYPKSVVLAADTVVAMQNTIFEKPGNIKEARYMIETLSGKMHDVFTGVMLCDSDKEILFVEQTKVEFWPLEPAKIDWYVNTDEPYDKAGAYGIQSLGALFVKQIIGDYYNVVGLPIAKIVKELQQFNIYPI